MAAASSATVLGCCAFTCHSSTPRRLFSPNRLTFPTARNMTSFLVLASNSERPGEVSDENPNSSSYQQDDLNYTLQLAVGSVAGAALVKYGSILFPDITQPNIVQALFMIFTPMIVAAYLLFKQSQADA